jgi:hypothetical protein
MIIDRIVFVIDADFCDPLIVTTHHKDIGSCH